MLLIANEEGVVRVPIRDAGGEVVGSFGIRGDQHGDYTPGEAVEIDGARLDAALAAIAPVSGLQVAR